MNSLKKNCVFSSKTSSTCYVLPCRMSIVLFLGFIFVVGDIVGGSVAASTATVLCHPLDVLRTRFIAQGEPKVGLRLRILIHCLCAWVWQTVDQIILWTSLIL